MSRLHLFNPENDIALAHGKAQYTAPPNAMRLHHAGALLPLWYCEDNDQILAPYTNIEWVENIKSLFTLNGNIATSSSLANITQCIPWGWSQNARKQYLEFGVNASQLPNDDSLTMIRELSHRRLTVKISKHLAQLGIHNPTQPLNALNSDDVIRYVNTHKSIYLKSPWSSSGRGIINSSTITIDELRRRAEGIIRNQGSVMCEKALNKEKDFAMLFYSDGVSTKYVGISSFFNTANGAYAGNIIGSQEFILNSIRQYRSTHSLEEIADALCQIFSIIISPHYIGYFGVDMMIYFQNGKCEIAPCVEVNLRMTMGVVAYLLSSRHIAEGSRGKMCVEYSSNKIKPTKPQIINKKIKSGTISLIPPDKFFNIYITVE